MNKDLTFLALTSSSGVQLMSAHLLNTDTGHMCHQPSECVNDVTDGPFTNTGIWLLKLMAYTLTYSSVQVRKPQSYNDSL